MYSGTMHVHLLIISFFVSLAVLSRIKLSFTDTIVRLEHVSQECRAGIGLELHIKR